MFRRMFLLGIGSFMTVIAMVKRTEAASPSFKENTNYSKMKMILGNVFYLQRIALPSSAILIIKLEDISRADAPANILVEQKIVLNGLQVPIPFSLPYYPETIDSRFRYGVRAQIFINDQLSWTSTKVYPVITHDNPTEVEIKLEQV